MSPAKESLSSPHLRPSNISKPPLRALYDLLIAPMEGVRARVFFFSFFLNPSDSFSFYSQQKLPAVSSGTDAQQRTGGQTQAAGAGAGGRAVPHTVCLAQRQLLQRVSLRKVQPHFCTFSRESEGNGEGKKIAVFFTPFVFYPGQLITLITLLALQKAARLALGFQLLFVYHMFSGRTELTHLWLLSVT